MDMTKPPVTIIKRWEKLPPMNEAKKLVGKGYEQSTFSPVPVYPGHVNTGTGADPHYWHVTGEKYAMYKCQLCPGLVRIVLIAL